MIKYTYELIRDEGDETCSYKPQNIPTELDNITCIEGPNSIGKSTLLNMIALGFYGTKNNTIHKSLQDKLRSLSDSEHQQATFHIQLDNPKANISLIAEKPNIDKKEIKVTEIKNGKKQTLGAEQFLTKYNLIYDIPDNPLKRIETLVKAIRDAQENFARKIGNVKEVVKEYLSAIQKSKDPNRISELSMEIDSLENKVKKDKVDHQAIEERVNWLQKYCVIKQKLDYEDELREIKARIDDLEKKTNKTDRTLNRSRSDYDMYLQNLRQKVNTIEDRRAELANHGNAILEKTEIHLLDALNEIKIRQSILQDHEIPESFESCLIKIRQIMKKHQTKLSNTDELQRGRLYEDLIEFLRTRSTSNDLEISIIGKTVGEFISLLEEEYRKYTSQINITESIENTLDKIEQMEKYIQHSKNILLEINKLKLKMTEAELLSSQANVSEEEIAKLTDKLAIIDSKYKTNEKEWQRLDSPTMKSLEKNPIQGYKDYTSLPLRQLNDHISQEGRKLDSIDSENQRNQAILKYKKEELENLQSQKPHKLYPHREYLDRLFNKLNFLESLLRRTYQDYLDDLYNKKQPTDPKQQEYYDSVFTYLAKSIGEFRHIDKQYTARNVDLLKGRIITTSKKTIHFTDMGTGQGQSAFLLGLLNTTDKRKIIALFDEVAMMDKKSMEPIWKKLRDLNKSGKLMAAIVVQRSDSLTVTSMNQG